MAPVRITAAHFSPDTVEFIRLLHRHSVKYLIVGGEAVIFHGHARLTGDVDFFFDGRSENTDNLFEALMEFWEDDIPVPILGLDSLIRNKEAAGRPKDLEDLQYLRRKQRS